MLHISREIRFALVSPEELANRSDHKNSWSAWPATNRIVPHLILRAVVAGSSDPVTGYLCNITVIDKALRSIVTEELIPQLSQKTFANAPSAESVLRRAHDLLRHKIFDRGELVNVSLHFSPQLSWLIEKQEPTMVQLTQQFEFSAAHRLNCDSLSPEQNKATFGKCNNEFGHGHNYVVEITVVGEDDGSKENDFSVFDLNEMAKIVNATVIDRLDHKNLNMDVDYFTDINPSVENISVAIWRWLSPEIEKQARKLVSVKVYETPKTWAEFSG